MIKRLQLECISYCTAFSLQAAAILLINEYHINGTFVYGKYHKTCSCWLYHVKNDIKVVVRRPPDFKFLNLVELLESYIRDYGMIYVVVIPLT